MDLALLADRSQRGTLFLLVSVLPVIVLPQTADAFGLPKATLLVLGAIVLTIATATRAAARRRVLVPWTALTAALAVFLVALVVATVTSEEPMLSIVGEYSRYSGLAGYSACIIVALGILRLFSVDDVRRLLWCIAGATTLVSLYGALQAVGADPYDWAGEGFAGTFATLGNANFLAGYLAVGVPAVAWIVIEPARDPRLRIAGAALIALVVPVMIATKSVQGPVAAAAGLAGAGFIWWRSGALRFGDRVPRWLPPVLAAAAVALVIVALPEFLDRLRGGIDGGLLERRSFWSAAFRMFGDDPITGVGLDTYGQHFLASRPVEHALTLFNTQAEAAHSVPLNMLATGGLVLGLAYGGVVVVTALAAIHGLRRDDIDRGLLGALIGAWVAYQVQSLVSIDVPALALVHFALAAAIVVIAVDPPFREVVLPGPAARRTGGRRQRTVTPTSTYVVVAITVTVGLVAAWWATRPLRADLAASRAPDASTQEVAIERIDKAIDLAPWQGRYWLARAELMERLLEPAEALRSAKEAMEREPGSAQYALVAAGLQARYFDAALAKPLYDAALERDPHNPHVRAAVATWAVQHDPERAVELARELVEDRPTSSTDHTLLGDALRAAGDEDGAIEAYQRALELDEANATAAAALKALRNG